MDILFLLVPLSVVLVLMIIGVFAWAVNSGQFDDLEKEGGRILATDDAAAVSDPAKVDGNQDRARP
jgi:cbb3-type cytochrome oxidase maturation protein